MDEWKTVDTLAAALADHFPDPPELVVVLGSGLGQVASALEQGKTVSGHELPGYPLATVDGHAGAISQGVLRGRQVMIVSGRVHLYEGHEPAVVVRSLRAAVTRGAGVVVLTNAAGGINPNLSPGALMLITDHINLTGRTPLLGPNDDRRGPRFPDMSDVYTAALQERMISCAARSGIPIERGVYAGLPGPAYETPAEVRMLATLGADAVGMSTVQEAIAVRHMGAKVAAISCITNLAAGIAAAPLDHDEVKRAGAAASANLADVLIAFIEESS